MGFKPALLAFLFFMVLVMPLSTYAQLSVAGVTSHSAKLNWSPGETRAGVTLASWNIYRAMASAGPFAVIANVPAFTTSYVDTTVVPGRRYFYKVTAVSTAGAESPPSSVVTAIVTVPHAQQTAITSAISLWPTDQNPTNASATDNSAVELGLGFTSDVAGQVTGIRFYKSLPNKGPHTGSLWSPTGTRLATGTFASETASGWQTLMFTTPIAIEANTTYVVSYHTAVGHYAYDENFFTAAYDNPPLHTPANAGVYLYGTGGFPNQTYRATNYWVDVIFLPGTSLASPVAITCSAWSAPAQSVDCTITGLLPGQSVPVQVAPPNGPSAPASRP